VHVHVLIFINLKLDVNATFASILYLKDKEVFSYMKASVKGMMFKGIGR